jgi:hypothetical protein
VLVVIPAYDIVEALRLIHVVAAVALTTIDLPVPVQFGTVAMAV